ncbi:response regulator transcription factor [Nostoc punctiforme]|uniref:Two component transcriptional regulator, LuxR family n=1 Tax=Nostoc punctiforme (strain ATCC 29133 / PCC 73102) TaxID=63737 RepID=B2JBH2_NOSP7|nr:response regulator transcription factor [Nostoc punctiforme]ACC85276.1 two component transcriptional regulator, LuxR family [Nostoc punctiforme PCC 73102]
MIRLLLVDDQDIFRQGLVALLSVETDLEVVGQARNGLEAIARAKALQPHVILMDVRMPVCDGVQATREIHQHYPWIRILVLTTFDDDEYILQSLQMGALGYLLKRTPAQEIASAIRSVSQGYSQLGPTIALKVFSQLKSSQPSPNSYQDLLSKREIGVLKLVGQGRNNQEIAQELHLSEGTVKNYVTQILNKLEMRDRIQAALWSQQNLL